MTQREVVLAQAIPDEHPWRQFAMTGLGMLAVIAILIFMVTRPAVAPVEAAPVVQDRSYLWVEMKTIGGEPVVSQPQQCTDGADCL